MLELELVDVNGIVLATDKLLRRLIGEDVELVTVAGAETRAVNSDPGQLEQVLINLALNARDAMPAGGKLTIETETVEHDGAPTLRLRVSDTGEGMDEATRARAFEPFFTTKEPGRGTGLGLATVYGIVLQSGGTVDVESEPGRGATFTILLPHAAAALPETAPPPSSPGGTETILLAEDEDTIRTLARRVLVERGYTVLEARHGGEALALAGQHEGALDLVLTDVVMPQMSGTELVAQLAAVRPGLRVLFMSGYVGEASLRHGLDAGGASFLDKPFTPDGLARAVRDALDG